MALRLRDLFLHPGRRGTTTPTARKDSRAIALDASMRMGSYGYSITGPKLKDYQSYLACFKTVPWVRACVQVIAYNAANIDFRLVKPVAGGGGNDNEDQEILDSPFLSLITTPNPYQSGFAMREAWWTDLELTGNAYIALEGMTPRGLPTEMYRLNPARVTVLPDRHAFIAGYRYTVNGRSVDYAPEEIVHLKYANPLDDFYGMGTIEAGEGRFESEMAMVNHERNFWQSGAKITGLFGTDEALDDSTFSRLTDRMRAFFQGSGYSTMLLENGLKYQSVSDSPAKLGMLEMQLASRDQIFAMFGVPPTKLGILERANYKADEADRFFWSETVSPKLSRVEDGVQALIELFHPGQGLKLRFKRVDFTDDVPQMTVAKLMSEVGVYTADEIRAYTGRDPMPDDRGTLVMALQTTVPLDLGGPMATVNERRVDQGLKPLEGGDSTLILPRGAVPLDVKNEALAPKLPVEGAPGQPPSNVVSMRPPAGMPPAAAAGKATTKAYDFGSTQANLPDNLAMMVKRYQQSIAPGDLAAGGLEDQPHITVKFGLHASVGAEDVAGVVAGRAPVGVRFGKIGSFPEGDDGTPLFVAVESPDMERLHNALKQSLPNTETHSSYHPHVTIAYVKPEAAAKYVDQVGPLNTRTAIFDAIVHSATDGTQTLIPLGKPAGKAVQRVSTARPATAHVIRQRQRQVLKQAAAHVPALQGFFAAQKARVLARLLAVPKRQKATLPTVPWWDHAEEDAALNEALTPLWTTAIEAGVQAARAVGAPIVGETPERMQRLTGKLASRVTGINTTTRTAIADQVTEGLRRGYSSAQIAQGVDAEDFDGVTGVFADAEGYRASMIARTELSMAYNSASLATYAESGVVSEVELLDGEEYDEACAERNGEVVSLDEAESIDDHPNGTLTYAPIVE